MIPDLDPKSGTPLYLQIVEQVRRLVALGALRPGERFMTVRELGAKARVNRNTAARAVAELERGGIVRTRVGQGTFIAEGANPLPVKEREGALDRALETLLVEAHSLGVAPEELGWRLSRKIEQFARSRRGSGKETA